MANDDVVVSLAARRAARGAAPGTFERAVDDLERAGLPRATEARDYAAAPAPTLRIPREHAAYYREIAARAQAQVRELPGEPGALSLDGWMLLAARHASALAATGLDIYAASPAEGEFPDDPDEAGALLGALAHYRGLLVRIAALGVLALARLDRAYPAARGATLAGGSAEE